MQDVRADIAETRERRDQIENDLVRIAAGGEDSEERKENLTTGLQRAWNDLEALEDEMRDAFAEGLRSGSLSSVEAVPADPNRTRDDGADPRMRKTRDAGLRAIDAHAEFSTNEAAARLEKVVRRQDPQGIVARYLDASTER